MFVRETFKVVLVSLTQWRKEICEPAGLGDKAVIDPSLIEWNYGQYEGVRLKQIQEAARRAG